GEGQPNNNPPPANKKTPNTDQTHTKTKNKVKKPKNPQTPPDKKKTQRPPQPPKGQVARLNPQLKPLLNILQTKQSQGRITQISKKIKNKKKK
ncbi:hypothetical protein ABFV54_27055, partial [Pseudomonas syringae]|uniref:hypothetical protein n=1 Tax=Pseudomonas syringae TaxID=317 RepID=UPI0034D4F322